uniref:Nose resistant-to-fluoxetine protein N-terminal domain-containing protein n=1 Tax=Timema cristinae TaxID=61476 RepID=A0A7R9CBY9_TIMCR|nr:unnamed protein product [Timema cristinae]
MSQLGLACSENSSENYLINKYNVDQSSKSDSFEDSQFRFIVENSTGNIAWQIYGVNRSFDNALKFPREMAMGTILKLLKEEQLELYAPITFMTNNDLCNKHLRLYRDSLVSNMSSWALKMFDSSSKLQYGLLTGNIFNLGNFEECLSVNVPDAAHAPLRGQHCIVEVNTRSAKRLSKQLFLRLTGKPAGLTHSLFRQSFVYGSVQPSSGKGKQRFPRRVLALEFTILIGV